MNDNIYNNISKAESSAAVGDKQATLAHVSNALKDALVSQCMYKKEIQVRDKISHRLKSVLVPCGHCYNCQMSKRNDWVSRCMIHTQYCQKYCYFVTLTYRPFESLSYVPNFLKNAYWHYDADNYNKRPMFSPCVLRHEHFQRFMKNLRRFTGVQDISFFMCGEYGDTHGRPHFHAIIWSDSPLRSLDFHKSWSFNTGTRQHPRYTLIGRVQIDDLNANGTIAGKFGDMSAHNCFAYVAKYCSKSANDDSLINFADLQKSRSRLKYLLMDIDKFSMSNASSFALSDTFDKIVVHKCAVLSAYNDFLREYALKRQKALQRQELDFFKFDKNSIYSIIIQNYEKDFCNYLADASVFDDEERAQCAVDFWKKNAQLIAYIFKPYLQCSRRSAIGSRFFNLYVKEFEALQFPTAKFIDKTIVLPRYFLRKTSEHFERYFPTHPSTTPRGLSSASFANESDRNIILQHHLCLDSGKSDTALTALSFYPLMLHARYEVINDPLAPHGLTYHDIDDLLHSHYAFYDSYERCKCLIFAHPVTLLPDYIAYYQFNRKERNYFHVKDVPISVFYEDMFAHSLQLAGFARYKEDISSQSASVYRWFCDVSDNLCTRFGDSFCDILRQCSDDLSASVKEYRERKRLKKNVLKHEKDIL